MSTALSGAQPFEPEETLKLQIEFVCYTLHADCHHIMKALSHTQWSLPKHTLIIQLASCLNKPGRLNLIKEHMLTDNSQRIHQLKSSNSLCLNVVLLKHLTSNGHVNVEEQMVF